jgi:hypothetical protein
VNSDILAAGVSGPVERVTLERSYHVATLDYDKDLVNEGAIEFARKVIRLTEPHVRLGGRRRYGRRRAISHDSCRGDPGPRGGVGEVVVAHEPEAPSSVPSRR